MQRFPTVHLVHVVTTLAYASEVVVVVVWWWGGAGGCKYTRSSERRRLPAIGAHAYVLARAERA